MRSSPPWVPYLAMAMLAALLVAAFFAREGGEAVVDVSPDPILPGHELTLVFREPQADILTLEFARDGHTYVIEGGQWRELTGQEGWVISSSDGRATPTSYVVTLPDEVEPGTYRVCSTDIELHRLCTYLSVSGS